MGSSLPVTNQVTFSAIVGRVVGIDSHPHADRLEILDIEVSDQLGVTPHSIPWILSMGFVLKRFDRGISLPRIPSEGEH